jgi:parvulin-like peptidyl-prolyl isomerase
MTTTAVLALLLSATAAGAPPREPDQDVICTVNGDPIRLKDLEIMIFTEDRGQAIKSVLELLVQERAIRQEVSRKGVSVKAADVDAFIADLDGELKATQKGSLEDNLAKQGMDYAFFRRTTETTIGLFRLAGGKGRPYQEMKVEDVKARMTEAMNQVTAAAKVEIEPDKLEKGVAATVNGERITAEEVGHVARLTFGPEAKAKRLNELQLFTMVQQEMRRRKLELTPDDIEYQFQLVSSARPTAGGEKDIPLEQVLRGIGQDPKLLRQRYGFRAMAMLTRLVKDQVTDEEAARLFTENPAAFGDGCPKASQIMLKTVDAKGRPLPEDDNKKIRAQLQALRDRLMAGEDFAALAGKFSQDPETADHGGNLGFLDRSRMEDPVVSAAWGLKVGEISPPVKGAQGWHLVKVTEVKKVNFEDVKPLVRITAVRLHRKQLLQKLEAAGQVVPGPVKP